MWTQGVGGITELNDSFAFCRGEIGGVEEKVGALVGIRGLCSSQRRLRIRWVEWSYRVKKAR